MRSTQFYLSLLALLLSAGLAYGQDLDSGAPPPPPGAGGEVMAAPPMAPTDMQMRINALETQLRNVTGQLERVQYQNAQLQQTLQRMNADIDGRFQMIERRVNSPPPQPVSM